MRRAVIVILATGLLGAACSEPPVSEPPPDWDFFGRVAHVEWTGDAVVIITEGRPGLLGEMNVTLVDGRVLRFPSGGSAGQWCRPIDREVFSQDYDNCWVAGTLDAAGTVESWETFTHGPKWTSLQLPPYEEVVDGAVVIRGIRFPLAEDVNIVLWCCAGEDATLEDGIGRAGSRFDTETGEIDRVVCYCRV
ncbi:MAG: hypothetical protein KJ698_04965 [Actinobacteria bacterium]|nr:hypothetical protein [Actinomycetota bacterium]MBU1492717.1 hypothetical protein [Actinomycetota bacterium]